MKRLFALSFILFVLIFSFANIAPAQEEHVPNEVLVKFKFEVSNLKRQLALDQVFGKIIGTFRLDRDLLHIQVPESIGTEQAISILSANPLVKYAVRNNIHHIDSTFPNDPRFGNQWALHNTGQSGGKIDADIDAPEAWDLFTGSPSIVVAVLDTGVDYNHEDLAANIWTNPGEIPGNGIDDDHNGYVDDIHGYDFAYGDPDPMDVHSHGTCCAGIIGGVGNNGKGVSGINWTVRIMCVKVLDDSGSGTSANIVKGMDYATENGAHLTSNSYGCHFCYNEAEREAIERANQAGKLFVAAAGNYGIDTDRWSHYPSCYNNQNIISVTATDKNDSQLYNYGKTTVDMAGCSPDITTTKPNNTYTDTFNGTSAACPHVAGVAALAWGYEPNLTHLQVKNRLMETARPVSSLSGKCVTGGTVNAYNALSAGGPPPEPPVAPTDLVASAVACNRIDLSWQDNSNNEDGFKIERSLDGTNFSPLATIGPNITSYSDTGLNENTTYWYRVKAYNDVGESGYSNVASDTTPPCGGQPPAAPSNLRIAYTGRSFLYLQWNDNSNNEDGFKIERSLDNVSFTQIATVGANTTTCLNSGLSSKTKYYYRVRAYNSYGNSAYSNTASGTTK